MRFWFILIVLISCISISSANALEGIDEKSWEKVYVKAEDIHPVDFGIFVRIDDEYYPVRAVFVDENGLFVCPLLE